MTIDPKREELNVKPSGRNRWQSMARHRDSKRLLWLPTRLATGPLGTYSGHIE